MGQLLHVYITTRKNVALTIQIFVSKMMSLLFNILSRFVIAFLPRSNHLFFFSFQIVNSLRIGILLINFVSYQCFAQIGVQ